MPKEETSDMGEGVKDGKYLSVFFISTALGCEPENYPKHILNKLVVAAPIQYRYLSDKFLYHLERKAIPARSPLPFAAHWFSIIEEQRRTNAHVASWLASFLYCEWALMYWFNETTKCEFPAELSRRAFIRSAMEADHPRGQILSVGTTPKDLKIKWWLDELVFRLRSIWDKIPYALADTNVPPFELKGVRHSSRVNELEQRKGELRLWPAGQAVFESLISELRSIDYIKKHRDTELHKHGKAYAEVFGTYGQHESLNETWEQLGLEFNRGREAIMATIGLLLREEYVA